MTAAEHADAPAGVPGDGRPPLLRGAFVVVVAAALCYFVGLGILAPTLPRYVEEELGGSGAAVGLVGGAFAVSAALLRPWVGRQGDIRGRRILVVGGCLAVGLSVLGYGLPGGLAVLVLMRLVSGVGEAATFIGAATVAQDLAPDDRRGEAASYFSIAVYGGLGIGPPLGDWLFTSHGSQWCWFAASGACLLGAFIGSRIPASVDQAAKDRTAAAASATASATAVAAPSAGPPPATGESKASALPAPGPARRGLRRWLHPAGLRPGVILLLGASGFAGYSNFLPLYVDQIGVDAAGPAFVLYAVVVLGVRLVGRRLPDILGGRRGPLLALSLQASGLALLAAWASAPGLYVSTAVFASGVSLLYPSLFPVVIAAAPEAERSQAVGTFSIFFDLSQGLGAPFFGVLVSLSGSERAAFAGGAALSALGFLIHARNQRTAPPGPCPEPVPPPELGE